MASKQISKPPRKIAVFYDGTFYSKVSAYYRHVHIRQSHLSFQGLHEFIRKAVAESEEVNVALCRVVEAHFFRGRFSLSAAKAMNTLESDRYLDQLLMNAGIVTHYYPMNEAVSPPEEKGIDVWLSLEAFDLAIQKRLDVLALFAGDEDFVPLVRKVAGIGTQVFVLGFDLNWIDPSGKSRWLHTSQQLVDEASYPIILNQAIDAAAPGNALIDGLFTKESNKRLESDTQLRGASPGVSPAR